MKNIKKIKKFVIFNIIFLLLVPCFAIFAGCKNENQKIKLYHTQTKQIETIAFEDYLAGVVAGEVDSSYPMEALKAQAVLARTFALKFLKEQKSKYEGADISDDITEAQAFNKERVTDSIKKAVLQTRGKTIKFEGDYINAWFFSNAGGQTALLSEGLNSQENLPYIKSVKTGESAENSKNYSWTATFSKDEILSALRNLGVSVSNISTFKTGEKGESGRCLTFIVGRKEVNASSFRLELGSTKLKSTLIDSIVVNSQSVTFSGRGYGHGVGLSQEYACILASEGKDYKQIIKFFFDGVSI